FLVLVDLVVIAVAWLDESLAPAQSIAGLAVFALLGYWTQQSLTNDLLNAALVFYFVFALVHSLLPLVFQRRSGGKTGNWAGPLFPILTLALVLVPIFKLADVSFVIWPFILLVDLLAIVIAVLSATLLPVLAVLLLTLAAISALMFKVPADLTGLPA